MLFCTVFLGPPTPTLRGVSYIRWGRTECPDTEGTELVYAGVAAGTHHLHTGGGAQYLCLPAQPQFLATSPGVQDARAYLHGTEYQTRDSAPALNDVFEHNVPCAVCYTAVRGEKIMIPAQTDCPSTWTREYYGYLMTGRYNLQRRTFECVDMNAEAIPGSAANTDGALFYFTASSCNGIECPPCVEGYELSCVVCTK